MDLKRLGRFCQSESKVVDLRSVLPKHWRIECVSWKSFDRRKLDSYLTSFGYLSKVLMACLHQISKNCFCVMNRNLMRSKWLLSTSQVRHTAWEFLGMRKFRWTVTVEVATRVPSCKTTNLSWVYMSGDRERVLYLCCLWQRVYREDRTGFSREWPWTCIRQASCGKKFVSILHNLQKQQFTLEKHFPINSGSKSLFQPQCKGSRLSRYSFVSGVHNLLSARSSSQDFCPFRLTRLDPASSGESYDFVRPNATEACPEMWHAPHGFGGSFPNWSPDCGHWKCAQLRERCPWLLKKNNVSVLPHSQHDTQRHWTIVFHVVPSPLVTWGIWAHLRRPARLF